MRRFALCLLPILAACVATGEAERSQDTLVTDGPLPEISVDGTAEPFVLRPGLTLPALRTVSWGGQAFTFRWLANGGELPYSPPPGSDDLIYPNMAFVGGTDDPRAAFIVVQVVCRGGYDPAMSYSIAMPPRFSLTGEWVFDVDGSPCDAA